MTATPSSLPKVLIVDTARGYTHDNFEYETVTDDHGIVDLLERDLSKFVAICISSIVPSQRTRVHITPLIRRIRERHPDLIVVAVHTNGEWRHMMSKHVTATAKTPERAMQIVLDYIEAREAK